MKVLRFIRSKVAFCIAAVICCAAIIGCSDERSYSNNDVISAVQRCEDTGRTAHFEVNLFTSTVVSVACVEK